MKTCGPIFEIRIDDLLITEPSEKPVEAKSIHLDDAFVPASEASVMFGLHQWPMHAAPQNLRNPLKNPMVVPLDSHHVPQNAFNNALLSMKDYGQQTRLLMAVANISLEQFTASARRKQVQAYPRSTFASMVCLLAEITARQANDEQSHFFHSLVDQIREVHRHRSQAHIQCCKMLDYIVATGAPDSQCWVDGLSKKARFHPALELKSFRSKALLIGVVEQLASACEQGDGWTARVAATRFCLLIQHSHGAINNWTYYGS